MKGYISQLFKLGRWLLLTLCVSLIVMQFSGADVKAFAKSARPWRVTFYGQNTSPISSAVAVPVRQPYFWTSGTVPPEIDLNAPVDSTARFGDMKTQAVGIFKRFETLLGEVGLSLNDVIYLRAYLVADPQTKQVDYQGWFDAYAQFFNNSTNPTKVARSTVAVAGLVNPGWLIEIEAVAVYPKKRDRDS
ncbi:MAG: RidA family protein [Gloeocapsa sp. UFS-A4-WI-NPMV-4B04]|jgi:enamine deaminase RidA (YjgF/YER057c/UK114 family)|nr:RidA family protein [Gloeocapsa sp. UFS-A4-WI-NPMV-4B04]